ncbi:MAG: transcriptional regulator [Flavobacteriales bacterium]|nr:transcriptional regulator [Flavobacteriales bacterium]
MNESQHIEWKQSWRDEYLKWICAFANTDGGTLFIGKDNNGEVKHLDDHRSLMEDIPSKIKNRLGILCPVNLHDNNGKKYIEIIVQAYSNPISYRGKYYTRSGSSTHELNGVELAEFLISKSGQTWDELIAEDATLDDIDPAAIQQFLSDSQSTDRLPDCQDLSDAEILEKLRLTKNGALKRAAILLFGKDPNAFFPNCKVMIGRFGNDATDLKFQEVVEGNVIHLLREVHVQLSHKFLTRPIVFEGLQRIEKDKYPVAALREMLLNALVHKRYMGAAIQLRVFDDRMSIWNEGRLPEGMTAESLKQEHNSKPANPVLADACFKAGYIDTWGRGTLKIYKACAEAGLPEPQIIEKDGGLEVTLFKADISEKTSESFGETSEKLGKDTAKNLEVLDADYQSFIELSALENNSTSEKLRRNFGKTSEEFRKKFGDKKALLIFLVALDGRISASSASEKIGVSSRTIETYFSDLKEAGVLERKGPDKGGYWQILIKT